MKILALESSCDEFAAAVIADGRDVLASVVASQQEVHARYGGVVPEIAGREHLRAVVPVLEQTLAQARLRWSAIDAIAVTQGPGLGGSLLVGVNSAKALAWALQKPCLPVHHIEGHLYANWLAPALEPHDGEPPRFPLICLVVSGGHTELLLMRDHGDFSRLGQTRDDAAGEAFDKVGRLLGLPFPGGPAIERVARDANAASASADAPAARPPSFQDLPRAWLRGSWDFSFSGLKTAVLHRVRDELGGELSPTEVALLADRFQTSVIDVLSAKTAEAAGEFGAQAVIVAGGVAANGPLRALLAERCPVPVRVPPPSLCTDNAAMIGAAAFHRLASAQEPVATGAGAAELSWDLFSTSGDAVFSPGS
jgi:N6-L-threonylcarbamoyladenine synthase